MRNRAGEGRWRRRLFWAALVLTAALTVYVTFFSRAENYLLTASLAAGLLLTPILMLYERRRPRLRNMMPVAVLAALACIGRVIFAFVPQLQPATALIIIAGVCLGARSGAMTGVLCALASNLLLGQGPWTLWQMLAWGVVGLVSAAFAKGPLWLVCVWSVVAGAVFSIIVDFWSIAFLGAAGWPALLAVWGVGLAANIPHMVGNGVFILLLYPAASRIFARLKVKYELENL